MRGDDPSVGDRYEGARCEFLNDCASSPWRERVPGRVNSFGEDRWHDSGKVVSSHFVGERHAAKLLTILKEPPEEIQVAIKFKPLGRTYGSSGRWHLDCWLEHVG